MNDKQYNQADRTKIALIQKDISYISKSVDDINTKIDEKISTKEEVVNLQNNLEPRIKKLEGYVDWTIRIVGSVIILALLALVIKSKTP